MASMGAVDPSLRTSGAFAQSMRDYAPLNRGYGAVGPSMSMGMNTGMGMNAGMGMGMGLPSDDNYFGSSPRKRK